jgi:TonB-dependent starch-binding outer membrane protein SusC
MKRNSILLFLLINILGLYGFAQSTTITGTVIDRNGEPLIGVTIRVEGTDRGVTTGLNGDFTLQVEEGTNLIFTFVGMVRKVMPAAKGPESIFGDMIVVMEEDYLMLETVQVVAYGTKTKREISGAIGRIDTEALQRSANTSIISGLTGRSAGLDVSSSADGRSASIRIRGVSSIRSGSNPLIVVDGMPTNQGISDINPEDILSVDVLKDAAASVLYGSRAANGVILITTRQGQAGKTKINVNYQYGLLTPSNRDISVMNADQWRAAYTTAARNRYGDAAQFTNAADGHDGFYSFDQYNGEGELIRPSSNFDTDWLGMIMDDNGAYNRVSVTASGGTANTAFFTSLLYRKDEGYMQASNQQRVNLRINLTHKFNDWLRAGFNLSGNLVDRDPASGMEGFSAAQTSALPIYPLMSPSNPDRYWYRYAVAPNFVAEHEYGLNFDRRHNFLNSIFMEAEPIENLIFRTEWQSDLRANQGRNWSHPYINPPGTGAGGGFGMVTVNKNENHTLNVNNTGRYTLLLGENHKFDLLAGFNFMQTHGGSSTAFQEQTANTTFTYGSGFFNRLERVASGWGERRFASGIGRINYALMNKYYIEGSYRKDGSSVFGPDMRWGDFKGVSASWIFSEENFVSSVIPALSLGRFRASWGEVGNAETGSNFGYLGTSLTWFNYAGYRGESFENIGNSSLQWETTKQTNLGMDVAFLNGRLEFNADYYNKISEDLLLTYQIGQFHGYWNSSITQNIGSLSFSGWEFSFNSINLEGIGKKVKWETNFNITTQKSEILKLSNNAHNIVDATNIVVIGQPLGSYYLVQWAGVDPVTGHELIYEVDPVQYLLNPAAAYIHHLSGNVIDANTMREGAVNQNKVIDPNKSPYPDFYGGITNAFSYAGFRFSFLFSYQFGNWYYDNMAQNMSYISAVKNASPALLEGWTADNPSNVPLLLDSRMAGMANSRFLHDASYIRLRDVTLSYDIPAKRTTAMKINRSRVFMKVENAWLWTRWPGVEPEATFGATQNISPGIRGFNKPMARTFVFGLEFEF